MKTAELRDRIIRKLGGGALFEGVNARELNAAFAGAIRAQPEAIGGVAPWSARIRTDHSSRKMRWLGCLFAVFLLWASFFHIDKVTRGQGRVLPSTQNQVVQHLEGGIVEKLLVREGQRVRKGQILMHVTNQFTSADYDNARTEVTAKKIALARMDAIVSGARDFHGPADLAREAPDIAASEEAFFYSQVSQTGQQSGIVQEQVRARQAEVASLRARLGNLRAEERLMIVQLGKLERAYQEEAISERDVLDKRSALLSLRTRIADVENQIPQTSAQLSESSARHTEVRTRQIEETKEKAAQVRIELSKAEEALSAYKDKHSREAIRAPIDGIVNKLYVQTVGGVIKGGEPIAEIVPVDKSILVEARILPKDRGNIWNGLPATVKISAYDSAIYGGIDAQLIDVSPDVLQDQKGEAFYRVRLKADAASFGEGRPVIPGMTAEVNIRSGQQTILDYILGPFIRLRDSALRE